MDERVPTARDRLRSGARWKAMLQLTGIGCLRIQAAPTPAARTRFALARTARGSGDSVDTTPAVARSVLCTRRMRPSLRDGGCAHPVRRVVRVAPRWKCTCGDATSCASRLMLGAMLIEQWLARGGGTAVVWSACRTAVMVSCLDSWHADAASRPGGTGSAALCSSRFPLHGYRSLLVTGPVCRSRRSC